MNTHQRPYFTCQFLRQEEDVQKGRKENHRALTEQAEHWAAPQARPRGRGRGRTHCASVGTDDCKGLQASNMVQRQ